MLRFIHVWFMLAIIMRAYLFPVWWNNITDLGCFLRSYLTHLSGDRCNHLLDLEMCFFGVNIAFGGRQIGAWGYTMSLTSWICPNSIPRFPWLYSCPLCCGQNVKRPAYNHMLEHLPSTVWESCGTFGRYGLTVGTLRDIVAPDLGWCGIL